MREREQERERESEGDTRPLVTPPVDTPIHYTDTPNRESIKERRRERDKERER